MKIQLYSDRTPNGWKIEIMLKELGIDYDFHHIDITTGDQFGKEFLAVSPNNKIPAIIDPQGPDNKEISLFESGAILIYLAENYKSPLLPQEPRLKYETLVWLMFQMGGIGPFLGQAHHFIRAAPQKIDYAITRYVNEASRLYKVMDNRLAEHPYLAADDYTIADIACFPWIFSHQWQHQNLDDFPNLQKWYTAIESRPAVRQVFKDIPQRELTP